MTNKWGELIDKELNNACFCFVMVDSSEIRRRKGKVFIKTETVKLSTYRVNR